MSRLTWDATYNGLPLSRLAYEAHMEMLEEIATSDGYQRLADYASLDEHQAWVAIQQAGLVRNKVAPASDGSFRWAVWVLTELGWLYLKQRSKGA
jgi:hypothetical protein